MKIAICTDQYLPLLSGIADSIAILADQLIKNGHDVRIYAPEMLGIEEDPRVMRLPSYALPGTSGGVAINLPIGALRDMRTFDPDVIHTHLFGIVGFLAVYASRRLGVPLVGTDHTFPADYLHYMGLNYRPFRYLVRRFAAWYYQRCAHITAPSKNMLDELTVYGCTRPMQVISNHIPSNIFRPLNRAEMKRKHGIAEYAVLVFGRIATEKNLDVALAVFERVNAKMPEAEIVFVGDGPYRTELQKESLSTPFARKVNFLGTKRGEELVEVISACDVFLITSLSETQSMTTLQAMACGLPVVVAKWGGLPEYVHDGETGFVIDPNNVDLFAEKILSLLNNSEEARRLGAAGRESIMQYSPERITAQFEEVYKTAC